MTRRTFVSAVLAVAILTLGMSAAYAAADIFGDIRKSLMASGDQVAINALTVLERRPVFKALGPALMKDAAVRKSFPGLPDRRSDRSPTEESERRGPGANPCPPRPVRGHRRPGSGGDALQEPGLSEGRDGRFQEGGLGSEFLVWPPALVWTPGFDPEGSFPSSRRKATIYRPSPG